MSSLEAKRRPSAAFQQEVDAARVTELSRCAAKYAIPRFLLIETSPEHDDAWQSKFIAEPLHLCCRRCAGPDKHAFCDVPMLHNLNMLFQHNVDGG